MKANVHPATFAAASAALDDLVEGVRKIRLGAEMVAELTEHTPVELRRQLQQELVAFVAKMDEVIASFGREMPLCRAALSTIESQLEERN